MCLVSAVVVNDQTDIWYKSSGLLLFQIKVDPKNYGQLKLHGQERKKAIVVVVDIVRWLSSISTYAEIG